MIPEFPESEPPAYVEIGDPSKGATSTYEIATSILTNPELAIFKTAQPMNTNFVNFKKAFQYYKNTTGTVVFLHKKSNYVRSLEIDLGLMHIVIYFNVFSATIQVQGPSLVGQCVQCSANEKWCLQKSSNDLP
jgi:hypothetical protein